MSNEATEAQLEVLAPSQLEAITRGEIDVQIRTAHQFPRSMSAFKRRAIDMATIDEETAESCIYVRPVGGGKNAEGLSVRMSEIVGASYGNLRVGSMIVEQTERYVVCRGFAHDLETNFASSSEVKEPTVKKDGSPYSEGQRAVVAKAALSKARRDATFIVVPKALCRPVEIAARKLIAGDAKSMETRKAAAVQYVSRLNINAERVWKALGVNGPDDLTSDSLITLTGLRNAIKDNDTTIDEAFPLAPVPVGSPNGGKAPGVADSFKKPEEKPAAKEERRPAPVPEDDRRPTALESARNLIANVKASEAAALAYLREKGVEIPDGVSLQDVPEDDLLTLTSDPAAAGKAMQNIEAKLHPAPEPEEENEFLAEIRGKMQMDGVSEAQVLAYIKSVHNIGNGKIGLAKLQPGRHKATLDNWADVVKFAKGAKAGEVAK